MTERILLMGGPGSGKSHQLVNICKAVSPSEMWVLDLEDKLRPSLESSGGVPPNMHLEFAYQWEEIRKVVEGWKEAVKPGHWVAVDRMDLTWPAVQRWYTQQKYNEELADRLLHSAQSMKGSTMQIPRFDQGAWQVINAQYEYVMLILLYGLRANVLLTSGVRAVGDDASPYEAIGGLYVLPRGQKELAHQPHSVLLLTTKREDRHGGDLQWHVSTAKDLPGREYFEKERLYDLSIQYPHFG